jgi:hypothetical protein
MSEEKKIEESSKPKANPDDPVGQDASGKPTQSSELKKENSEAPETKPTTSNQQPATDNMEVHKHPHDVTHKKKWGEYLLEFLMIFFAVFLGFLAENKREEMIEHSRAKEFAVGLVGSLNADITQFNLLRDFRIQKNKQKDSLLDVLSKPPNPEYDSSLHRLISQGLMSRIYYVPIDATWQEMKSTGALRYIKRGVADKLVEYYTYISELIRSETTEATEIKDFTPTLFTFLNAEYQYARRMNKPFGELKKIRRLKEEPEARNLLFNWVLHFQNVSQNREQNEYERSLKQANNLLQLIEREYHLKNE